mgnify:CR=1 FL=1
MNQSPTINQVIGIHGAAVMASWRRHNVEVNSTLTYLDDATGKVNPRMLFTRVSCELAGLLSTI